jgi:hypothetical protein
MMRYEVRGLTHPLVDFSLGAASAVPWLGETQAGMDPQQNPIDGVLQSDICADFLGILSKLTQKDDLWAKTSRERPRVTTTSDLLKLQEYTDANPDSYTTHAYRISYIKNAKHTSCSMRERPMSRSSHCWRRLPCTTAKAHTHCS